MEWVQRKPIKRFRDDDDIITKLAKIRGIDDIEAFLNPKESDMHDFNLLENIQKACKMILEAISDGKKISIFADVDCDGITSASIMYNYLKQVTDNVNYFHAQRRDGHGLEQAGEKLIPEGTELLIVVDSSTSDADACKRISENGLPIIIIDHHPIEAPNEYAVIVNNQLSPNYPNKNLSGAGMCLKVIQALDEYLCLGTKEFYDLAGVGIYADVMDMREPENRYIVSCALDWMSNLGLRALLKAKKVDTNKKLTSTDIGFTLSPLINGASRLGKIELILELLTTDDGVRALSLAEEIVELNEKRKDAQKHYTKKYMKDMNHDAQIHVFIDKEIDKNYAGLVANEIMSKCNKPVLVLQPNEKGNYFQGSYRSPVDLPFRDFIAPLVDKNIVSFVAGHQNAGGIGIGAWNMEQFKAITTDALAGMGRKATVTIEHDLEFHVNDITLDMVEDIMKFDRVTGQGIPQAMIKVTGLFPTDAKLMGKKEDTVKIISDGIDIMKFRTDKDFYNEAPVFVDIDAIGTLNINKWKQFVNIQMMLEDYKVK